jgi:Tetratricopeptide repeat
MEESILAVRESIGIDSSDAMWSREHLANDYLAVGERDKAIALYEHAAARMAEELVPDHPNIQKTLAILANIKHSGTTQGPADA